MLWLGIDFETTGLSPETERVTEIGAVLYDMDEKKPVLIMSELVQLPGSRVVPPEITKLTGITDEMLKEYGLDEVEAFTKLAELVERADYLIAHNAPFDRGFYDAYHARRKLTVPDKKWLDSRTDVDYPEEYSQKLVYLAAHHGFINPFAHRAVFDVLTMFKVIEQYDPMEIIRWAETPNVMLRALVTFNERDLAKQRGYHWRSEQKWWVKHVKEFNVETEVRLADELGFETREVDLG